MKKVKFILPVMAILFAVAGVFATGKSADSLIQVRVTALSATPCTDDGYCDTAIMGTCTLNSGLQFKARVSGSSCSANQTTGQFVFQ